MPEGDPGHRGNVPIGGTPPERAGHSHAGVSTASVHHQSLDPPTPQEARQAPARGPEFRWLPTIASNGRPTPPAATLGQGRACGARSQPNLAAK